MQDEVYQTILEYVKAVEESQKVLDTYPSDMSTFLVENKYVEIQLDCINKMFKAALPKDKADAIIDDVNWYLWDAPRDRREITVWGKVYLIKTPEDLIKVIKLMRDN